MSTDVEFVRGRADLAAIAHHYSVKVLRRSGNHLVGLCPFHSEKTPSFYVHPVKQVFKCHGCGAGGDVFRFVELIERAEFPRALAIVADLAGLSLSRGSWTREQQQTHAALHADRELLEHFSFREGFPERERGRAGAVLQAACSADPEYRDWLLKDLQHAKNITAAIVAIIAVAQERESLPTETDVVA